MNSLTVQWGDFTKALHDNGEFCAIFLRGVQSFDTLDPVSKLRFSAFFNRFFKNFFRPCIFLIATVSSVPLRGARSNEQWLISLPILAFSNGGKREGIGTRKSLAASWATMIANAAIEPKAFSTYSIYARWLGRRQTHETIAATVGEAVSLPFR